MSVMTGSDIGIDGDWKCFICSVQTLSNALLINHMLQIHSQTPNPGRDLSQSLKEMFQNDDCQINDQQGTYNKTPGINDIQCMQESNQRTTTSGKPPHPTRLTQNKNSNQTTGNNHEIGKLSEILYLRCSLCSKRYKSKQHLQRHKNEIHISSADSKHYSTNISEGDNTVHVDIKFSQTNHACPVCFKNYSSNKHLRRHVRKAHFKDNVIKSKSKFKREDFLSNIFKKKTCQQQKRSSSINPPKFDFKSVIKKIFTGKGSNVSRPKKVEKKVSKSSNMTNFSEKSDLQSLHLIPAPQASTNYNDTIELNTTADETTVSRKTVFNCNLCSKSYTHKQNLSRHFKKHPKLSVSNTQIDSCLQCPICLKTVPRKFSMRSHLQYHARKSKLTSMGSLQNSKKLCKPSLSVDNNITHAKTALLLTPNKKHNNIKSSKKSAPYLLCKQGVKAFANESSLVKSSHTKSTSKYPPSKANKCVTIKDEFKLNMKSPIHMEAEPINEEFVINQKSSLTEALSQNLTVHSDQEKNNSDHSNLNVLRQTNLNVLNSSQLSPNSCSKPVTIRITKIKSVEEPYLIPTKKMAKEYADQFSQTHGLNKNITINTKTSNIQRPMNPTQVLTNMIKEVTMEVEEEEEIMGNQSCFTNNNMNKPQPKLNTLVISKKIKSKV